MIRTLRTILSIGAASILMAMALATDPPEGPAQADSTTAAPGTHYELLESFKRIEHAALVKEFGKSGHVAENDREKCLKVLDDGAGWLVDARFGPTARSVGTAAFELVQGGSDDPALIYLDAIASDDGRNLNKSLSFFLRAQRALGASNYPKRYLARLDACLGAWYTA